MKKKLIALSAGIVLLGMAGQAQALLITSASWDTDWLLGTTVDGEFEWGYNYTTTAGHAWGFSIPNGYHTSTHQYGSGYGLALCSGQVSDANPVPEPATMLLFSTGLAGLAGYRRKRKGKSV